METNNNVFFFTPIRSKDAPNGVSKQQSELVQISCSKTYGCRRFGADIVDDAVDALDFVDNA